MFGQFGRNRSFFCKCNYIIEVLLKCLKMIKTSKNAIYPFFDDFGEGIWNVKSSLPSFILALMENLRKIPQTLVANYQASNVYFGRTKKVNTELGFSLRKSSTTRMKKSSVNSVCLLL